MQSAEVRQQALDHANEIRLKRAALKRDLRDGKLPFTPLLLDPPDWLERAPIAEILRAVRYMGRKKVAQALHANGMSAARTFGGTPLAQRERLDAWLRNRHPAQYPGGPRDS